MPKIFDNLEQYLLPTLQDTLKVAYRADFCIGYFRLSGWQHLETYIDKFIGGEGTCCRLLIGMSGDKPQTFPIDNKQAVLFKRKLAIEFRAQLAHSIPSNTQEATLRRLAQQLKDKKVILKLFLRSTLHAKLYLLFRKDKFSPVIGYLGSSNLTYAGLSGQGELNIDVVEGDACQKLATWFQERWQDRWCIDISTQLIEIIEQSWACDRLIPPYHIYLKMAYHLSQEARAGLNEFTVPREFGNKLFEYQSAAVRLAARHLSQRNGVLIGDVVGLGKTLMAIVLAKIFENVYRHETLIICPKNLVDMWKISYCQKYLKMAEVLSITMVKKLAQYKRYHLIIIDESHNLRNRDGQRYKAIRHYIERNDCKVILLSATPYNKTYLDLANQLRLFITEDEKLPVCPEKMIFNIGGVEKFKHKHQCAIHSIAAYEKSDEPEDWRKLMRLYMVRRTRSFILENYALTDLDKGQKYLPLDNGTRAYFPARLPKTATFEVNDQYAKLYSEDVVTKIAALNLPRYGLGAYLDAPCHISATEEKIIKDLSKSGQRLIGFCRTNLFKRLESSGEVFMLSLERLILRNSVYVYALENDKDIPIGSQDIASFDSRFKDDEDDADTEIKASLTTWSDFQERAAKLYGLYEETKKTKRFKWLPSHFFSSALRKELKKDSETLFDILTDCGAWQASNDAKLKTLEDMLTQKHPEDKILIFTQFADTAVYLHKELCARGLTDIALATGNIKNPTALAWQFSPISNEKTVKNEIRVLIATDVLSEGQNLQDAAIVVNYDLPWAIIRLIQRVGRVDRIGQQAQNILCYSFLPAEGVEKIINLRGRLKNRLTENAEVVGTDEEFFEEDDTQNSLQDLYHEKTGVLDGEADNEVDLVSEAYAVWTKAIKADPTLEEIIPALPAVVHASKAYHPKHRQPEGVLVYIDTPAGNDAMMWLDDTGTIISDSLDDIFKLAACEPETPALARSPKHHHNVQMGIEQMLKNEKNDASSCLGRKNSARYRTYYRLKDYLLKTGGLLDPDLEEVIKTISKCPLQAYAVDILNDHLHNQVSDKRFTATALNLYRDHRLCVIHDTGRVQEPKILCSLGLRVNSLK